MLYDSKTISDESFLYTLACDDAKISIWNIPEGGIKETVSEASMYLRGMCVICSCIMTQKLFLSNTEICYKQKHMHV